MADLNPIINPQINLEQPISMPGPVGGTVDIGGALAGLVGLLPRRGSAPGPSANDVKGASLREFNQTVNDWYNSDMAPQDFQTNVRGLAMEALAQYPQYRTDIMGVVEAVGVSAPTLPVTSEDAYNASYNEYMSTPIGAANMLAAARFTGGTLDEPATYAQSQVYFQKYLADKAEAEQTAMDLEAAQNNNSLYTELETQAVRDLSPKWATKARDVFSGMLGAASQGDASLDTPEEQIAAVVEQRRTLELAFRQQAQASGITDPEKYQAELDAALAPFDTILSGLKSKEASVTSYLNAYNATNELGLTRLFVEATGSLIGSSPAYQEAFMQVITNSAYQSGKLTEIVDALKGAQATNLGQALTVFPNLASTPAEGVGTRVEDVVDEATISDLREKEKNQEGFLAGQIDLATGIILNMADPEKNPQFVLDNFSTVVASASAREEPLGNNRLKAILNPSMIRILSETAGKGAAGKDIESLISTFAGDQIRRNKILIDNLAKGLNVTTEMRDGKLVVLQNGKILPSVVNDKGRPETLNELVRAVNNINYIASATARAGEAGPAVKEYTGQMFSTEPGNITDYLNTLGGQDFTGQLSGVEPLSGRIERPAGFIAAENADPMLVEQAVSIAQQYGIPASLFLNQIGAESSWKPGQTSKAGAVGYGQLMPGTAAELGVDPNDPLQNLEGAARYLRAQKERFGTWELALAAYNAGPTRVAEAGGIPNIKETRDYVAKIMGNGQPAYFQQAYAPTTYKPVGSIPQNVRLNPDMNPLVTNLDGASSMTQPYAADHMDFILNGPFQIMQQAFGGPLTINDGIAKAGTSRENSTPGSQHFHGNALDISLAGMSDEDKLRVFQSALQAGFTGFGFGNNILHVDIGPTRSWDYGIDNFGGMSIADLQAQIAGGASPRLVVPTKWNGGKDADAGDWLPETDPEEGAPQNFNPIRNEAPSESPRPEPRPTEKAADSQVNVQQPQGKETPSASQKTSQGLDERTKAMLAEQGFNVDNVKDFTSEQEIQAALDAGEIKDGQVVILNGKPVMVEK